MSFTLGSLVDINTNSKVGIFSATFAKGNNFSNFPHLWKTHPCQTGVFIFLCFCHVTVVRPFPSFPGLMHFHDHQQVMHKSLTFYVFYTLRLPVAEIKGICPGYSSLNLTLCQRSTDLNIGNTVSSQSLKD